MMAGFGYLTTGLAAMLVWLGGGESAVGAAEKAKPNIVIILGDDFGYGDFGCYGATKIKTPHVDQIASQGVRFTSGYATGATCTPTRYALVTGQYAWRRAGTHILPGDAPLCIPTNMPTIASVLKQAGYQTAVVGKWHLGLGSGGPTDYNHEIDAGPRTLGFDYSFLVPATGDRVPCVYVENHRVVNLDTNDPIHLSFKANLGDSPTAKTHLELVRPTHRGENEIRAGTIINGICRIGFMTGGRAALWQDDSLADTLTSKALAFIRTNRSHPFFLYFATHDVHAPLAPNPRFNGTSQCGKRGDTVQQFDWCVGQVLDTLQELGLADDTLVILASDNGAGGEYAWQEKEFGHRVNGPLRGFKVTPYEGGTRVPFMARWPGVIPPAAVSDQVVALVDCLATAAAIAGVSLPTNAAPDSVNLLPVFRDPRQPVRDHVITQSGVPSHPACAKQIRVGQWKLIARTDGRHELYDLENDLAESKDLAEAQPEIVKRLAARLEEAIQSGHTRN